MVFIEKIYDTNGDEVSHISCYYSGSRRFQFYDDIKKASFTRRMDRYRLQKLISENNIIGNHSDIYYISTSKFTWNLIDCLDYIGEVNRPLGYVDSATEIQVYSVSSNGIYISGNNGNHLRSYNSSIMDAIFRGDCYFEDGRFYFKTTERGFVAWSIEKPREYNRLMSKLRLLDTN